MADLGWFVVIALSMVSAWMALFLAPRWFIAGRVRYRLTHRALGESDERESWLSNFAERFTSHSLVRSDYEEMGIALETTGRNRIQAQTTYLGLCWLLPAVVIPLGFVITGPIGGSIAAAGAFLLPRRIIRTMGANAEKRQNLEAIELCHMTRMLMEAGVAIERALRIIALQARPVMPQLCVRLDQFNRVMESGADRTVALEELGKNRRILVLRSYVNLMKQSGALGSGVSAGLDQIIKEAQQNERSRLKEETNRIGAKMTIVMMVFMLPALFILVGGPAVMAVAESLGR